MIQGLFKSPFLRYIKSLYNEDYIILDITSLAWCDKCNGIVFGIQTFTYRCLDCNYTCHAECRPTETLGQDEFLGLNPPNWSEPLEESKKRTLMIRYESGYRENFDETQPEMPPNVEFESKPQLEDGEIKGDSNSLTSLSYSCSSDALSQVDSVDDSMKISYIPFGGISDDDNENLNSILNSSLSSPSSGEYNRLTPTLSADHANQSGEFFKLSQNHVSGNVDESMTGAYIHLGINILRPIFVTSGQNVVTGLGELRSPNDNESAAILETADGSSKMADLSAFFLPCNTITSTYITPQTTALDVVTLFLRKFEVADNVRKFELYNKRTSSRGKTFLQKMDLGEKLWERAAYTFQLDPDEREVESPPQVQFVLKDHIETEILWDSFSIPELRNFLQILNYEERESAGKIKVRYDKKRVVLEKLINLQPPLDNNTLLN